MVLETRICRECGQEFDTDIKKKVYCSKKCSNKRYNNNRGGRYYEGKPPVAKINKSKSNMKEIEKLNSEARALGMTYGQYVAMKEMGMRYE